VVRAVRIEHVDLVDAADALVHRRIGDGEAIRAHPAS